MHFPIKWKSCKMLMTNQVTYLPCLVLIGPAVLRNRLKWYKLMNTKDGNDRSKVKTIFSDGPLVQVYISQLHVACRKFEKKIVTCIYTGSYHTGKLLFSPIYKFRISIQWYFINISPFQPMLNTSCKDMLASC